MALAAQEMEGWQMLAAQCNNQVQAWDARLNELDRQRKILRDSKTRGLIFLNLMRAQAAKVDESQIEVDKARENPIVARILDRELKRPQVASEFPSAFPAFSRSMNASVVRQSPSV